MKPPLAWLAVAALAVAMIAAIAIFIADRRGAPFFPAVSEVRVKFDSVAGAVEGVVSAPAHWAREGVDAASAYVMAGSQNQKLKAELAETRFFGDQLNSLRDENARLRALLGVRTDPPLPMVGARTVVDARGPFSNTRLADVGADQGVMEGNPVLSEHGLVGRVIGVAPGMSRILLLTDVDSRVPVLIARTNARAILTGDGGPNPKLAYLRTHDAPQVGDRVLTSGDGGVIPRGLPVGRVVQSLEGWRVALDCDAAPIDFVRILLFRDFSQLVAAGAMAPKVLPPLSTAPPTPTPAAEVPPDRPPAAAPAGAAKVPVAPPSAAKVPAARAPTDRAAPAPLPPPGP
jgi:rod shape-determining protein MreC